MEYELDCECGNTIRVRETAAGAREQCPCGRTLVVPSLHELRRRAGLHQPELPIETVVETLLLARKLPADDRCALCGTATDGLIWCTTECERAYVQSGRPARWVYLLGLLTFGWVGAAVVHATAEDDREWGKDRVFPLPLRVCAGCRPRLDGPSALRSALWRVPVYRRLLEKYPGARITVSPP
jgi:hypothetical protein